MKSTASAELHYDRMLAAQDEADDLLDMLDEAGITVEQYRAEQHEAEYEAAAERYFGRE